MNYTRDIRAKQILAQGGFGTVYIADVVNPKLIFYGKPVVVKQHKSQTLSDREIQMFYQEISLMEYFKGDENIAQLIGYTLNPYTIVMKHYQLGSLSNWLKTTDNNRTLRQVISFALDIARGVNVMHGKGVVHKDLKPDNVLIDCQSDDETTTLYYKCILADFGIAQIVTYEILQVKQFEVVHINAMSLAFAAPERILSSKKRSEVKGRDLMLSWDVYSVGIILFQLLNGCHQSLY